MRDDDRHTALEALLGAMEADAADEKCGRLRVVRRGRDADGAKRWLCRSCRRTFRGTSGSVLASSRLGGAVWAEYAAMMVSGATSGTAPRPAESPCARASRCATGCGRFRMGHFAAWGR